MVIVSTLGICLTFLNLFCQSRNNFLTEVNRIMQSVRVVQSFSKDRGLELPETFMSYR